MQRFVPPTVRFRFFWNIAGYLAAGLSTIKLSGEATMFMRRRLLLDPAGPPVTANTRALMRMIAPQHPILAKFATIAPSQAALETENNALLVAGLLPDFKETVEMVVELRHKIDHAYGNVPGSQDDVDTASPYVQARWLRVLFLGGVFFFFFFLNPISMIASSFLVWFRC